MYDNGCGELLTVQQKASGITVECKNQQVSVQAPTSGGKVCIQVKGPTNVNLCAPASSYTSDSLSQALAPLLAMQQTWLGQAAGGCEQLKAQVSALGVSVSFIFVYVLFGALLDRAGAGNYMMQLSFALLGHLRGGPAKVSVVSSALNGLISGSSVSNVVSGGIFTIPLMKRIGYRPEIAGAIEACASCGGPLMPPIMGAGAFIMAELTGIPYSKIIVAAALPAIL